VAYETLKKSTRDQIVLHESIMRSTGEGKEKIESPSKKLLAIKTAQAIQIKKETERLLKLSARL
jgi:hypothetical protein